MHLLQNISSAPRCAFKANASSPLTEIQFVSGEPHNVRAEVEKSDITVCVGTAWMGMWRGVQGISKASEKHTSPSKILIQQPKTSGIWSSVVSPKVL